MTLNVFSATIEVTAGLDGLSIGEREIIMRHYDDFIESTSREGVTPDLMRIRVEEEDDFAEPEPREGSMSYDIMRLRMELGLEPRDVSGN